MPVCCQQKGRSLRTGAQPTELAAPPVQVKSQEDANRLEQLAAENLELKQMVHSLSKQAAQLRLHPPGLLQTSLGHSAVRCAPGAPPVPPKLSLAEPPD